MEISMMKNYLKLEERVYMDSARQMIKLASIEHLDYILYFLNLTTIL